MDATFFGLTILDVAGRPIERIPDGGDVGFIEEIRMNPAGTAAGAVMNAAKMGIKTAAVACVGSDHQGDFIVDTYTRMGIDTTYIQRTDLAKTSATILAIRGNGERPAMHARGASDHLFFEEDDFTKICRGPYLHHGGTGLLNQMDGGQSAKLMAYAKHQGIVTSLDLIAPNADTMHILAPILPHLDYFMPSMEEAAFLSKLNEPEDICNFFLSRGVSACILKWGAKGAYVKTKAEMFRVKAFEVEVSDTTGCGDSFCGAFVAGLAKGMTLRDACELGSAVSGLVATGLGSDAGVVDFQTTKQFIATANRLP